MTIDDQHIIKILMIEDDEDDYLLTKDYLSEIKGLNLKLDWISNYEEAFSEILQCKHDIYLIDYILGKESGLQLMKSVIEAGCMSPIIILTGQDQWDLDLQFIQAGAADYLAKSKIDAYMLEKSILYSIERNKYKNDLLKSQSQYKDLFEELKEKNALFSSLINSIPLIIGRFSKNYEILEIYGSGLKKIVESGDGKEIEGQYIMNYFPSAGKAINQSILMGNYSQEEMIEYSGRENYYQTFYFYHDELQQIIGIAIDITALKQTQQAYDDVTIKNKKLTRINDLLDDIIYMAAHDLRSPISNIRMANYLIEQEEDENEKKELMEKLNQSTNRLDQVLDGLIEIIEIQKEEEANPDRVLFSEVLEQAFSDFEDQIVQNNVKIDVDLSAAPSIRYEKVFIASIIHNMLGNAIKYRSQEPLHVGIRTYKTKNYTVLEISDNGMGIDLKRNREKIFRPFSRFSDKQSGKGIGLHLVKTIVEKNGGFIEIESELGQGTTFKMHLSEYI